MHDITQQVSGRPSRSDDGQAMARDSPLVTLSPTSIGTLAKERNMAGRRKVLDQASSGFRTSRQQILFGRLSPPRSALPCTNALSVAAMNEYSGLIDQLCRRGHRAERVDTHREFAGLLIFTSALFRGSDRLSPLECQHRNRTMIVRPLGNPIVKQCSRASLSVPTGGGIAASLHEHLPPSLASSHAMTTETRCFSTSNHRTFSSLPHHLARKNNGMVNVFVKSTKVPRPIAMVPERHPQPKTRNRLQKIVALEKKVDASPNEEEHLPSHFSYAGNASLPVTSELKIVMPQDDTPSGIWPAFRMMVSLLSHSL